MWDLDILTIFNLIHPIWLYGFVVTPIACIGALIVMARVRQARKIVQGERLTRAAQPVLRPPKPAIVASHVAHDSNFPFHPSVHRELSPHNPIPSVSESGAPPLTISPVIHSFPSFASALEASGDLTVTSDSVDAPEDAINPPIWRRIESLIEEHRATTFALTGEALGEAALIEPAPPIWRGVNALRIEVAKIEGAPEAAEQEIVWERAPQPPIWRAAHLREYTGPVFANTLLGSEHDDTDPASHRQVASVPPIWSAWLSDAWPETHAQPIIEDSEPPIWSSFMRQR